MRALRFYDQRDIRLEDIPTPSAKPGFVRIKVKAAGLSQTQVNEFIDGPFIINQEPHPLTGRSTPLIPCQEFGGLVDQLGEGVDERWLNQQVAVLPLLACGKCDFCRSGEEHHCESKAYSGLVGADGGFAEYAVVPVENIYACPRDDLLTFMEPLLVGIHVVNKIRKYCDAQRVLVVGAGAVGCAVAAICQYWANFDVNITDILESRLTKAAAIGLSSGSLDQLNENYDVVIDAAGHDLFSAEPALNTAIGLTRKGGTLISVGTYFQPIPFIPAQVLVNELNVITSFMYSYKEIQLLNKVIEKLTFSFEPLITKIPFHSIIEDGYYRAEVDKSSFTRLEAWMD